ncbi:MAG: radical SAM/SPASM domain-containing protein [Thermodesulfobacteriota bacterium]
MNATIKSHRSENRTPLQEVIPLETPYRMHIEVTNLCNFKCIFCPPYNSGKGVGPKKQNMSFPFFKKIIDDLGRFPQKLKKLYFHNFGEPLINKHLPAMIQYAKDRDVTEQTELITNGSLLAREVNRSLVRSGLDHITISVEGLTEHDYLSVARYKIRYARFIDAIRDFFENKGHCTVHIKIADIALRSKDHEERFYHMFGDMADTIFIENIVNQDDAYPYTELNTFKSTFSRGQYGEDLQNIKVCPSLFFMLTVNSDGSVSPCCVDWRRQVLIGHCSRQTLLEIWHGAPLSHLQILHLQGQRHQHAICSKCNYLTYSSDPRDNIDEYADRLLHRLRPSYDKA